MRAILEPLKNSSKIVVVTVKKAFCLTERLLCIAHRHEKADVITDTFRVLEILDGGLKGPADRHWYGRCHGSMRRHPDDGLR